MRYFVFGDTGGHLFQLRNALIEIGMDERTFKLPENTSIIHLGDLIHKGPHSDGVVNLVDSVMDANSGRWFQMLGNHEFQYFKGAPTFWNPEITQGTVRKLESWAREGLAAPAFALPSLKSTVPSFEKKKELPNQGALFTHAGLTSAFWGDIGSPSDVMVVAERLNALTVKQVTVPGSMLLGANGRQFIQGHVGPIWAAASGEVFPSWEDLTMPFMQFHGHTTAYGWMRNAWWPGTTKVFRNNTRLVPESRLSVTSTGGSLLMGLDPGFSNQVDVKSQPYLILETE